MTYVSGLSVPPNTTDLSLSTLIGLPAVYILLVLFARWKDRQDVLKMMMMGTSSSEPNFPLTELPGELLAEVLSHVPAVNLLKNCSLVNRSWNVLVNSQKLWKDKCEREGMLPVEIHWPLLTVDFKRLYFHNPYRKNLIKNPCANEGMNYWQVDNNGGDGFRVEKTPAGSHPVENYTNVQGSAQCWATSYRLCKKIQTVDLIKEMCSPEVLDETRPDIYISEWYAARFDCGIRYKLKVELLDEQGRTIETFKFKDTKPAGKDWFQVTHIFTGYGPGVRHIRYTHSGIDTQFWAGHYGSKFTLSSVKFHFSGFSR